jgi:hypothetical protein
MWHGNDQVVLRSNIIVDREPGSIVFRNSIPVASDIILRPSTDDTCQQRLPVVFQFGLPVLGLPCS